MAIARGAVNGEIGEKCTCRDDFKIPAVLSSGKRLGSGPICSQWQTSPTSRLACNKERLDMAEHKRRFSGKNKPARPSSARPSSARQAATAGGTSSLAADEVMIYGIHAIKAALANMDRRVIKILATRNAADRIRRESEARGLVPVIVEPEAISLITGPEAVHQGMLLIAKNLATMDLHDVMDKRFLVVLDQITDPHNVGAIIRSAVAMGADAIITTHRNAPRETGLLAKTASGGLDCISMVHVTNLAQALIKLRDFGFVTIGLDSEAPHDLANTLYGERLALVLGAEGSGLRRLARERCDTLARLDMPGTIKSLNVSNAAALSFFMAARHLKIIN